MIISADALCVAAEATLKANLADVVTGLDAYLTDVDFARLGEVVTWQQVPVVEALETAKMPAVAIISSGMTGDPTTSRSSGVMTTTFGLGIGVYSRGKDHNDTQARVRDWCAAIRMTLLMHKSLGGVVKNVEWVGERYELVPDRDSARTFGAGVISFDVTVELPLTIPIPSAGALPTVETTPTTLSVQ